MNDFEQIGDLALSGMKDMQTQMENLMDTTDRYIGGGLENLLHGLARADGSSTKAARALDRFSEHILTVFTKEITESVFDGLMSPKQSHMVGNGTAESGFLRFMQDMSRNPMAGSAHNMGAGNSGAVNVTVYNNTAAHAEVKERTNSQGQREIEIMIDNMVAQSLTAGAQTRSVLRSVFGIDNLLSSR